MKVNKNIIVIFPILSIIFGVGIVNSIDIDDSISESENRSLAQMPNINDFKDRTFTTDFDTYYTDQFVGRDKILKLYTKSQINRGKTYVKDYYIDDNNWILESLPNGINKEELSNNASTLNEFADLNKSTNIYYISLPHKVNVLNYLYPSFDDRYKNTNKKKNYFLDRLDKEKLNILDIGEYFKTNFTNKELENFYFKTDHHWNSIGGFESYKKIINEIGILNQNQLNIFNEYVVKNVDKGKFVGSYNRNLYELVEEDESVPYVYNPNHSDLTFYKYEESNWVEDDIENIWATEMFTGENKKSYGGSYVWYLGYYKVINEKSVTDKKLLIFRDSYQGAMAWMFSDIFREVVIVDSRHIKSQTGLSAQDIIKNSNTDYTFIMYNDYGFNRIVPTLSADVN